MDEDLLWNYILLNMPDENEVGDLGRSPFRIGEWRVEPSLNRLSKGDTTIQLELKVMDVLVCLAERAGEVVTRIEIIDRVWATEFIADNTLTHAINEIRTALGDDARNPSFIETIHRRGYRLMVPITPEERPSGTVAQFPSRARPNSDEDLSPYPGLAAFTEVDAEFFFGREAEVAQMWRKITSRRLLAVIGPSGVGKSSFLRAGVIPAKPDGWGILVCHPGEAPFAALARALLPEFRDDPEALSKATEFQATATSLFTRWRERHDRALLIVDQFEELFTLNTPDVQARYASLIGSLAREADVHVVLAMRDDFLYRCHAHDSLRPILEDLSALAQPDSEALRRSMTEPARRLEFAFEDEKLAEEMVSEVEGERGALPMLAFAAARLWEKRDREMRQLTRQAYQDIGGVAGALARHAEATLQGIGGDRLPIVREIFRNMVTAEGTRAVREWNELLSVFPDSRAEAAAAVLRTLIDARLLTSYEVREEDREPTRRVEIIHESLLVNWPRLVGWQTQDADAARIRDQLRQAARTWDDHERTNDLLWTGSAYREFSVWREGYPGGLTEIEEDFAEAMTSFAAWRRRRRRIFVSAGFALLLAGLTVVGIFWQRSVRETRRAESQKLIALGQVELDSYPTASVAYALASLEIADNLAARLLAVEALWKGPTSFTINEEGVQYADFSPDGSFFVQSQRTDHRLRIIESDGSSILLDQVHTGAWVPFSISPGSNIICSRDFGGPGEPTRVVLWSVPDRRHLAEVHYEDPAQLYGLTCSDERALALVVDGGIGSIDAVYPDGSSKRLGSLDIEFPEAAESRRPTTIDSQTGRWFGTATANEVFVVEINNNSLPRQRSLGRHGDTITRLAFHPTGRFLATADANGLIKLWDPLGNTPVRSIQGPEGKWATIRFTRDGSHLEAASADSENLGESWVYFLDSQAPQLVRRVKLGLLGSGGWRWDSPRPQIAKSGPDLKTRLWQAGIPADADPVELLRGKSGILWMPRFHPDGRWLATTGNGGLAMWPLARSYASVIRHHRKVVYGLEFGPNGEWFASSSMDGTVRLWPLSGDVPAHGRVLLGPPSKPQMLDLAASPNGEQLLVGAGWSDAQLIPLDGGPPVVLQGFDSQVWGVAFSPKGRLAAAVGGNWEPRERVIRVWDVASGEEVTVLGPDDGLRPLDLEFTDEGSLLSGGESGLLKWDLETGQNEVVYEGVALFFATSADRRKIILVDSPNSMMNSGGRAVLLDVESGTETNLETHGDRVSKVALGPAGDIAVTGSLDGIIRVGLVSGEEPHLLLGHKQSVEALAIDPLGRWIASGSEDSTVRLWPMPDLSKPPLHTLPHEELIAKLKTLTNLRVIRDEDSPTGWKLTHDPFPGWETVPTW